MPIVACIMGVGASGGYYVSMAADAVVIHPTGVTGSIGVIGNYVTFDGLMKKIGVDSVTFKSGQHKDMGSPFRPVTDDEKRIFQSIIGDMYGQFVEVVTDGRPGLDEATVRKLADGRVYTAQQAKEAGLVDEVGYLKDAIEIAKRLAKLRDASVVSYKRPGAYKENIYSRMPAGAGGQGNVNFINVDVGRSFKPGRPVFLYLWAPDL